MNQAPEHIFKAVLETIQYATVYCRNYTLKENADLKQVNEIMEAIHDLPSQLYRWNDDAMKTLNIHLSCFDHNAWPGAPNLNQYFDETLKRS